MSEVLSLTEIGEQHAELLPARTVMSMFAAGEGDKGATGETASAPTASGDGNPITFLFNFANKLLPMK